MIEIGLCDSIILVTFFFPSIVPFLSALQSHSRDLKLHLLARK